MFLYTSILFIDFKLVFRSVYHFTFLILLHTFVYFMILKGVLFLLKLLGCFKHESYKMRTVKRGYLLTLEEKTHEKDLKIHCKMFLLHALLLLKHALLILFIF